MRPKLAFAWFLVSAALAALLVVQWRNATAQKTTLQKVQLQVEKLDQQAKAAQARAAELEKENAQVRGQLRAAELEAAQARQSALAQTPAQTSSAAVAKSSAPAKAEAGPANPMGMMQKMLKDPEMRKMIEQQQKMAVDMMYDPLLKKMQLDPEKAEAFKKMLLTNQLAQVSQAAELVNADPGTQQEAMAKLKEQTEEREQEMRSLLGEEKYQEYQQYNQTIGERVMLEQFGKNLDLEEQQKEALLGIMLEEKQNAQINQPVLPNFNPNTDMPELLKSEQLMEQFFAQQDQVNERVAERARQVLSPEQFEKFGPFMSNQTSMQRMGINMARKMMNPQPQQPGEAPTVSP